MSGFFRPWRRKVGVLTLLIACVFTAGWVRSNLVMDLLQFPIQLQKKDSKSWVMRNTLHSMGNTIVWTWTREGAYERDAQQKGIDVGPSSTRWLNLKWTKGFDAAISTQPILLKELGWEWYGLGFGHRRAQIEDEGWEVIETSTPSIPYWLIVLPLALFSAWLILSQPGSKKPPERFLWMASVGHGPTGVR